MEKWSADFEALRGFTCPKWFADAKLGIWSHWGPQSVPMFGDWYARNMYIQGTEQNLYHVRHYGHPSRFGYKDICALWQAERFDPEALMALYVDAGAQYFVAQAMHHDNFFNYDSALNPMNSVNVGPKRDICALWKRAADRFSLPFGLSEHLGASFQWWRTNKGADSCGPYAGVPYDGNDPAYREFYHDNYEHTAAMDSIDPWYTPNARFRAHWLAVMRELTEKFTPDLLYTDGGLPFADTGAAWGVGVPFDPADPAYAEGLAAVAELYAASAAKYGESRAVYCQKDRRPEVYRVGVLDIEKSQLPGVAPEVWQTDTCIGNWFYDAKQPYKKPAQIIEMLVDIISKNGVMLLNILQRPDGEIDAEAEYILRELAAWRRVCGEGVFGSRPYRVFGEGETRALIDGFRETRTRFTQSDWRFTAKPGAVYAFMMCAPERGTAVIKSVTEKVRRAELLGWGELEFEQSFGVVTARLPQALPTQYVNCIKLSV